MPEAPQTVSDEAGVTRTPTGTIVDQNQSIPTQPSTPEPQKETKEESKPSTTKAETKPDAKESKETGKSLINEKSEEPKGAPANYTDFAVPEGFTLDPEVAKEASTLFRELDLNQSSSQKLVDFYVAKAREAFNAPFERWQEQQQKWRDEINSNPEIGGSKLNGTKASIGRLIDSFGKYADGFRTAMDDTGAGNHPAVIGALNHLSKILTEGGAVRGNGPSSEGQRAPGVGRPSAAQALYPNLPSQR
jgi:hypothetical protein